MSTLGQQNYLIAGLGKTGWSCVRFLRALGANVMVTDTRSKPPLADELTRRYPDVPTAFGGLDQKLLKQAEVVVASPGLPLSDAFFEAARRRELPIMGDIELFARVAGRPVAAITGSNGKSTVTQLVADMARAAGRRAAAGGNLGTPALDLLEDDVDLYVLELSSFQLELTEALSPSVGVVLNVSADHMDRHGTLERYAALKARVYEGAGAAVINGDDPLVRVMGLDVPRRVLFSAAGPASESDYGLSEHKGQTWLMRGGERLVAASELQLKGEHNLMNALAALAVGECLGLERAGMLAALRVFAGLAHRCQQVGEYRGVMYYNDSKATNVGACQASLEGLPGPIVWIAGGQAKDADFTPLAEVVRRKVRAAVLIGQDAQRIARDLGGATAVHFADSLEEAVIKATGLAQAGDTVLLSPACSSFDMFSGFEERGKCFESAVRGLDPCVA